MKIMSNFTFWINVRDKHGHYTYRLHFTVVHLHVSRIFWSYIFIGCMLLAVAPFSIINWSCIKLGAKISCCWIDVKEIVFQLPIICFWRCLENPAFWVDRDTIWCNFMSDINLESCNSFILFTYNTYATFVCCNKKVVCS